jgi:hypothetical protein
MEPCLIIFLKKNGDLRVMLGTRNQIVMGMRNNEHINYLEAHDKRCTRENNTIGVYDLILGESRSFNIERLVNVTPLGYVEREEQLDQIINKYIRVKDWYDEKIRENLIEELDSPENIITQSPSIPKP